MAATVMQSDPTNDTKVIQSAMGQLGKDVVAVEKSLDKMKKLQATIAKKPDECAKTFKALYDEIGTCIGAVSVFSDLPKKMQRAVYK